MAFGVTEFKSNLFGSSNIGGARPALFKIGITDSSGSYSLSSTENILVKAGAIPAANIAPLPINYAGRAYKMSGFRTYDNWSTTILNDEDFSIRNKIMDWMYRLSGDADGMRSTALGMTDTPGEGTITQVGVDGLDKSSYKFYNMWPTELSEIALDWSSDAVEEYTVTWAYDYWTHGASQEENNSEISWT